MSLLKMGKFPISHTMRKYEGSANLFRNPIFLFHTQCKNIRGLRTHFAHPPPISTVRTLYENQKGVYKTQQSCVKPNGHAPKPKGLCEFLFKSLPCPHFESTLPLRIPLPPCDLISTQCHLVPLPFNAPPPWVHLTSPSFHFPILPSLHFHMVQTRGALTAPSSTRTLRQRAFSS